MIKYNLLPGWYPVNIFQLIVVIMRSVGGSMEFDAGCILSEASDRDFHLAFQKLVARAMCFCRSE